MTKNIEISKYNIYYQNPDLRKITKSKDVRNMFSTSGSMHSENKIPNSLLENSSNNLQNEIDKGKVQGSYLDRLIRRTSEELPNLDIETVLKSSGIADEQIKILKEYMICDKQQALRIAYAEKITHGRV